jgi:hypothetical protein
MNGNPTRPNKPAILMLVASIIFGALSAGIFLWTKSSAHEAARFERDIRESGVSMPVFNNVDFKRIEEHFLQSFSELDPLDVCAPGYQEIIRESLDKLGKQGYTVSITGSAIQDESPLLLIRHLSNRVGFVVVAAPAGWSQDLWMDFYAADILHGSHRVSSDGKYIISNQKGAPR